MINVYLMVQSFSAKAWRVKRKKQCGCTPGYIPSVLDVHYKRGDWGTGLGWFAFRKHPVGYVACRWKIHPKKGILGRLIRGSFSWKVGPPFCFWWSRSCGEASCPSMTLTVNRSRLAEICCSSLFFPATGSMVLQILLKLFVPSYTEQPHAKHSFSHDLPWHHLGKPFLLLHVFWLIEFLRRVSPAAVNSLLTASVRGNTDKLSLPVWIDKQIHCRVN